MLPYVHIISQKAPQRRKIPHKILCGINITFYFICGLDGKKMRTKSDRTDTELIFKERLELLIEDKRDEDLTLSAKKQADKMKIPYSTFCKYINDDPSKSAQCSISYLVKMADYYGVSTDYLLGRVEEKSPDYSVQAVCKTLGLTNITSVSEMLSEDKTLAMFYFDELLNKYPELLIDLTCAIRYALKADEPVNILYPSADLSEKKKQTQMLASFLVTQQLQRIASAIIEKCLGRAENG